MKFNNVILGMLGVVFISTSAQSFSLNDAMNSMNECNNKCIVNSSNEKNICGDASKRKWCQDNCNVGDMGMMKAPGKNLNISEQCRSFDAKKKK